MMKAVIELMYMQSWMNRVDSVQAGKRSLYTVAPSLPWSIFLLLSSIVLSSLFFVTVHLQLAK